MTIKYNNDFINTIHKKTSSLYKVVRSDHSIQSMNTDTMYQKTKPHLRSVIRLLNAEGVKPAEICMRI